MNDNEPRTEFEHRVVRELQSSTFEWTTVCLSADELLQLADESAPYVEMERMRSHTTTCVYCCQEYVDLRRSLLEADRLRAARGEQAPLAATPVQSQAVTLISALAQAAPTKGLRRVAFASINSWKTLFRLPAMVGYALAAACAFLLAYVGAIWPLQKQTERLRQGQSLAQVVPELKAQLQRERNAREQEAQQNEQQRMEMQSQASVRTATAETQNRKLEAKVRKAQQDVIRLTKRANRHNTDWLHPEDELALRADTKQMQQLASQTILAGGEHTTNLLKIKGLQPSQTRVDTLYPRLYWQPVPGATIYKISLAPVLSDGTLGDLTLKEKETAETEIFVTTKLTYGQIYEWQADAYKAGEAKPFAVGTARFAILDSVSAGRLAPLHLHLGDVYAKSGLVENAQREWQAIPPTSIHYQAAQKRQRSFNAVFPHNP